MTAARENMALPESIAHDPEAKKKILNRLKRAQGQLAAVIDSVEDDSHCREVVQQLSAVSKALDRAGFLVISHAMRQCMTDPTETAQKPGGLGAVPLPP